MDHLYKDQYQDLLLLLNRSHKCINKDFKIGIPEGPPVLESVYSLQMRLRKTEKTDPSSFEISAVLNEVIDYFDNKKTSQKTKDLLVKVSNYIASLKSIT